MNDKTKTEYLKGLAIISVLANHFANIYVTRSLSGYANGMISIFFLLSGYGIYRSFLSNKESDFTTHSKIFFKKRALRIYPLFWIWCVFSGFENGVVGFLALDFINPISPWFVPAILQCYMISPLLLFMCSRTDLKANILIISSIFIGVNILLFNFADVSPVLTIGYRRAFFLHIFIFYLGFVLAQCEPHVLSFQKTKIIISLIVFLLLINETTNQGLLAIPGKQFTFPILMGISLFIFSYFAIYSHIVFPLSKVISYCGKHAYSIYLFHGSMFFITSRLGLIEKDNTGLPGMLSLIVLSPLFILAYSAIETVINGMVINKKSIGNAIQSFRINLPFNK